MKANTDTHITIPLRENNLAEALAGMAIIGIAEKIEGSGVLECKWENDHLHLKTELPEYLILKSIEDFVLNVTAIHSTSTLTRELASDNINLKQFLLLQNGAMLGGCPLFTVSSTLKTSVFKSYTGLVNLETILEKQLLSIPSKSFTSIAEYVHSLGAPVFKNAEGRFTREVQLYRTGARKGMIKSSEKINVFLFDSSTGCNPYDLGFSSDGEETGPFDPVYPAREILAYLGLAFFLPWSVLCNDSQGLGSVIYFVWREYLPSSFCPLAFSRKINGLDQDTMIARRLPKGAGDSRTKFFSDALLVDKNY